MKVDMPLILRVAQNARLNLTEEEIKEFLPQLKEILDTFSKLKEVDTGKVIPSFQPLELKNITRKDKIEQCLTQAEALENSTYKENGYFKGPKTL